MTAASTTSPGYDIVLLAHVLSAVVGLVALAVAAGSALALRSALRRGGPVPDALARYYRPGVNWPGRTLFLVPVFGIALLAMSGGEWSFGDTWVSVGMVAWAVVAVAAEAALWPEERRLQEVVVTLGGPDADVTQSVVNHYKNAYPTPGAGAATSGAAKNSGSGGAAAPVGSSSDPGVKKYN